MGNMPIKDLKVGMKVNSNYLLLSVNERSKKNGGSFYTLSLGDSSGSIPAIMWDGFEAISDGAIKCDDYVLIQGEVKTYQESTQLIVKNIIKLREEDIDPVDFLPHTPFDINILYEELKEYIKSIKNRDLGEFLKQLFLDSEIVNGFKSAPSALSMHQAYIGGLLEHTVNVARNCIVLSKNYSQCDADLLLTGALIHDMGKVYEFEWMPKIQYSDRGHLLGHIILGMEMLCTYTGKVKNFPKNLKTLLSHLVVSHHGTLEWGSPKQPRTLEAILLHYADNIDAKSTTYIQECGKAKEKGVRWTDYIRMFEHQLFAGFDERYPILEMQDEKDIPYRKPLQPDLFDIK